MLRRSARAREKGGLTLQSAQTAMPLSRDAIFGVVRKEKGRAISIGSPLRFNQRRALTATVVRSRFSTLCSVSQLRLTEDAAEDSTADAAAGVATIAAVAVSIVLAIALIVALQEAVAIGLRELAVAVGVLVIV